MNRPRKEAVERLSKTGGKLQLRDLSDFCQQWPDLKLLVEDSRLERSPLESETVEVIGWLRDLADRVCPGERL
jgi:hypothetical protein